MMNVSFNEDTLFVTVSNLAPPSVTLGSTPMAVTVAAQGLQGAKGDPGADGAPGVSLPIVFARRGVCEVLDGRLRYRMPFAATLTGYSAAMGAGTPPLGAALIADINLNGIAIATLTVPDGAEEVAEVALNEAVSVGDFLTVDITQVGSTEPGSDLSIFITYEV
jgi:hypothetical protein